MRIVIDLQGAQTKSRFRGIGRYTLSFTKALIREGSEHEFFIVLNGLLPNAIESIRQEFSDILPEGNILVWTAPGPISTVASRNTWRHRVAELIREAFIESLEPDLIHISSFMEGYVDNSVTSIGKFDKRTPVTVSLYDLIPLTNQKSYLDPYPPFKAHYLDRVDQLRKATRLLSISKFCKQEGLACLGLKDEAIVNVSSAVSSKFKPANDYPGRKQCFEKKFGICKSYILYTGGTDDRKNLPRLIAAFSQLPSDLRNAHQLVFAGKLLEVEIDKLRRARKSVGLTSSELVLTGYISDEDLIQLYSRCALYVFPSWHEGFGLPALEAMACGAPVIGSNASSLPEVIGNRDVLFDPMSVTDIADKIAKILSDKQFRKEIIYSGIVQSRCFTWKKSAKTALSEFEKIHRHRLSAQIDDNLSIEARLINSIAELDRKAPPNDLELARIANNILLNRRELKPGL